MHTSDGQYLFPVSSIPQELLRFFQPAFNRWDSTDGKWYYRVRDAN